MILSGDEIVRRYNVGDIFISDFNDEKLNPNSYNLSLHDELLVYRVNVLDMARDNPYERIKIPEDGLLLKPGELYLGRTREYTETNSLVPMIEGRSSIGRLGIFVHVTAGFGDVGFEGYWTLEIHCVKPVVIYPYIDICQIYYHTIQGDFRRDFYRGKYQGNNDIQTSRIYEEFIRRDVGYDKT